MVAILVRDGTLPFAYRNKELAQLVIELGNSAPNSKGRKECSFIIPISRRAIETQPWHRQRLPACHREDR